MAKSKFIRTRSLQDGMRIDQSILDKSGRVLINRGTILDDYMISSMLRLGIGGVYIGDGVDDPQSDPAIKEPPISKETKHIIEKNTVADRNKVQLTQMVKERVNEGVQFLFNNTNSNTFLDTTNRIAKDLMRAITENDAIAVDIDALKVSDEYTFKHSVDVATMSMIIAKKHGFSDKEIYEIGIAGLLHDIGKTQIPPEILNKPARLTPEEFTVMKQHSLYAYNILKEKENLSDAIRLGVLQHHEKINGTGYPLGVPKEKICLHARILAIADIYDALITERPYKQAFSKRDAVEILMSMTDELDISVMKSFLGSVILYPVGSLVKLSNGEVAKVVENKPECILRPTVVGLESGQVYNLADDINCASIIIL